jgi:hypothetical protein
MTESADHKIHKVTVCASLSRRASSTSESIMPINLGINPEKYEHPCQVEDLNLGEQVTLPNQLIYDQFIMV